MRESSQISGSQVIREFLPQSPFVGHVGIELSALEDGRAELTLPFRDELTTIARVVHGGAIATLIDTAAMTAAWAGAELPDTLRGATVDLSVSYLEPAEGRTLTAVAEVVHRGRRLVTIHIDVHDTDDTHVATALATYQLG